MAMVGVVITVAVATAAIQVAMVAVVITVAVATAAIQVATVAVATVAIQVATVAIQVATVAILNLIVLIPINPQVQKVGKIEVMGTLLRILNMKVAEVEEKGESQMEVMLQMMKISNPFL